MFANINNECSFVGRMTKDPELTFVQNGKLAKTTFILAVDRNLTKDAREKAKNNNEPTADFVPCVILGAKAEAIANYFIKGKPIMVKTVFKTYKYTNKAGDPSYGYQFEVVDFGFVPKDNSEGSNNNGNSNNRSNNNGGGYNNSSYDFMDDMTPVDDGDLPF